MPNNKIVEIKNTLEKNNSRKTEAEECISELEYGIVEIVRTGITALERGDKDITNYGEYFN